MITALYPYVRELRIGFGKVFFTAAAKTHPIRLKPVGPASYE
jgi:hypothetical protein